MEDQSVILNIEVKTADAIKGIGELNDNIIALKKTQEQLDQDFKDGTKTFEEYSKETKKNSSDLREQEKAFKSLTSAVNVQEGSINELRASTKLLSAERNTLNLNTAEGQKRLKEINDQIDKNNAKIRENVSSLEQQKINIGNYASALDGVVPGLGSFTQGVQGATSSAKSFIATPFGAILAAIAIALGAVYKYLEKFEPVLDVIENAVTQVTSAFDSLIQNLDLIGSIVGNVLTLNFDKAGEAANKLGKEISNAAKEGQAIIDLTREIEDATIAFELSSSKVDLQIKRLVTAAKNRTLTAKEQQDLLNQALELENGQLEKNLEIKKMQFEADARSLIQSKKAQLDKNQAFTEAVQQNKTLKEQFEIVAQSGIFSPEQLSKALASYKAIDQAEGESLAFQEKVQNQKDAIAERDQARREKEKQDAEKRKAEQEKELARLTELQRIEESFAQSEKNRISDLNQFKIESQKSVSENIKGIVKANEEGLTKITEKAVKDRNALKKQEVINEAAKEQQLRLLRDQALSTVDTLFQKNKDVQIGLALVSTYLSAQKAYESQFLPVPTIGSPLRGAAAAALAVIQGLARVQAIRSVDASGGSASVSTSSSGRSGVTATQATTNPINQTFSAANAFRNMPPVIASWQEATTVRNRVEFKEALTTV